MIDPTDREEYETNAAIVRAEMGEQVFEGAWDQGRMMPLESAVAYALGSPQVDLSLARP